MKIYQDPAVIIQAKFKFRYKNTSTSLYAATIEYLDSVDVNEPYKYPVCPSFTNWRFPHDSFPTHWSSPTISRVTLADRPPSAFSEKILVSNGTCIVTGYTTSVQACHLCPHSQADLFRKNKMESYNLAEYNRAEHFLDDTANWYNPTGGPQFILRYRWFCSDA